MTESKTTQEKNSDNKKVTDDIWFRLSRMDVSKFVEEKNGFSYLSWAHAWACLKDHYPDATFRKTLFDHDCGKLPYMIDPAGYAYVSVTVEAGGRSATEVFPVLDYNNQSVKKPDSFSVNTALQRCLAKAISYLGLGIHIYAGEDLPISFNPEVKIERNVGILWEGDLPEGVSSDFDDLCDGVKTTVESDKAVLIAKTADMIHEVFVRMLPNIKSVPVVENFYKRNKVALDILKRDDEAKYNSVIAAFARRKAEILKQEKGS